MPVIGRVSVILKKADITQENVDVIVNSSNQNLDLNTGCSSLFFSYEYFKGIQPCNKISSFTLCFTGVSGEILKAAGQSVVDECKKNGNSTNKIIEQHFEILPSDTFIRKIQRNHSQHRDFHRSPACWQCCAHRRRKPEL